MPVLVEQDASHAPGVARLRLPDAKGLDPSSVEVRITSGIGGSDRHLDPSLEGEQSWSSAEKWFTGASVEAVGDGLAIDLGPSATWHLKPYQPYLVAFRDGSGTLVEDRMNWIALRLPSEAPPPSAGSSVASAGYPEAATPEPEPEAEPGPEEDPLAAFAEMAENAPEEPEVMATPTVEDEPRRSPVLLLSLLGLLVAAAAAALVWFLMLAEDAQDTPPVAETTKETAPTDPPQTGPEPVPLTVDGARTFLQGKPEGPDTLKEAERFADAGEHEGAFLLFKSAARKGQGQAALRMARYYDPETHDPALGVVPSPDAEIAANWYEDAARAGEVEAMARLGEMMKGGMVERPDAPEQGVFWLNKAAEAGSEKAKELLK